MTSGRRCRPGPKDLVDSLGVIPLNAVLECISKLPIGRPAINSRSRYKSCTGLVNHILNRAESLECMAPKLIEDLLLAYFPFGYEDTASMLSDEQRLFCILRHEYEDDIMFKLRRAILSQPMAVKRANARRDVKLTNVEEQKQDADAYEREWPTVVPRQTVFSCLERYYEGSKWREPLVCAVCAQYRRDAAKIDICSEDSTDIHLDHLLLRNEFIIRKCVVQSLSTRFSFVNKSLDARLMLERQGVFCDNEKSTVLRVCSDGRRALSKKSIPRFALANGLYRGELPNEFHDLTWVEEKICAISSTTAHVTRLFQSSDPSQPKVFHGNTCAHDMNVTSTESVLPRTPADVAGFLSVVFVCPQKFDARFLGSTFRVRKAKISAFLTWSKHHNRLYAGVPIDPQLIELYPEDGTLPGVSERVIEDNNTDPTTLFENETTVFEAHAASFLYNDKEQDVDHESLLEKMGVSDPESVKLSGRTFTAAALRNLNLLPKDVAILDSQERSLQDLPDPESRYASLKASLHMNEITIRGPNVYSSNGIFIHPAEYNEELNDGDIVEVDVILRLCVFLYLLFLIILTKCPTPGQFLTVPESITPCSKA